MHAFCLCLICMWSRASTFLCTTDTGVPYAVTVEVGVSNIITASEPRIFFTRELGE